MTGGERVRIGNRAETGQPASRWRKTNAHSKRPTGFAPSTAPPGQPMPPEIARRPKHYFRELNRIADKADPPLPELAEATAYLAR